MVVDDGADAEERAERAEHASVRSERPPTAGGSLSPRSARMSLALKSSRSGHSEAFSPAFLSPRMWNEEDMLLPPSSEVPSRPVITGRESQDKGCFGLFTFVMVLFLFQGTAAIFGANYQMPHEFALCRSRLQQVRFGKELQLFRCGHVFAMFEARFKNTGLVNSCFFEM